MPQFPHTLPFELHGPVTTGHVPSAHACRRRPFSCSITHNPPASLAEEPCSCHRKPLQISAPVVEKTSTNPSENPLLKPFPSLDCSCTAGKTPSHSTEKLLNSLPNIRKPLLDPFMSLHSTSAKLARITCSHPKPLCMPKNPMHEILVLLACRVHSIVVYVCYRV
ncbi:hypothetical protein AMTRI_Chr12g237000 [Amborella trichopoda]